MMNKYHMNKTQKFSLLSLAILEISDLKIGLKQLFSDYQKTIFMFKKTLQLKQCEYFPYLVLNTKIKNHDMDSYLL